MPWSHAAKKTKQFLIFWATTIPGRFPETEKGFNVIDATIINAGKKYVMFVKDETRNPAQKNIRVATASSLFGPYSAPSEPITGKYWAEGPTSVKINDTWYVYFDKYIEKKMGAVCSKDLITWEDISDKVSFPDGMRHGTVIEVDKKILEKLMN